MRKLLLVIRVFVVSVLLCTPQALSANNTDEFKNGRRQEGQHNYAAAIESYAKSLAIEHPQKAESYYRRANCYVALNQYAPCILDCTKALSIDPRHTMALKLRAFAYLKCGNLQQGIDDYTQVLKLDPTDEEAHVNRALAFKMAGKQRPESTSSPLLTKKYNELLQRGASLHKQGYPEKALPFITNAIDIDSTDSRAFFERAECYMAMERHASAFDDYAQASKLAPKNPAYLYGMGQAQIALEHFDKAIDAFNKVVELQPNNRGAHLRLGQCYSSLKKFQQAADEYTKHVAIQKTDDKTIYRRADAYKKLGHWQNALDDYTLLAKKFPEDEDAHRYMGDCYFQLHQYEKALEEYTNTIKMDPDNAASVYTARANAYLKLGKPDLAKQDMLKAKSYAERR